MLFKTTISLIFFIMCVVKSMAQTENEKNFQIHIKKTKSEIKIDGLLNETDWSEAQSTTFFNQQFPFDTSLALMQTKAKVTFDDKYFYYSFEVQQPKKYIIQSLKRDFPHGGGTDLVLINLDTFKDKQNAFHFAVNPYGVQREGLVFNGNEVTNDWDNKWFTAVTNYDDKWIVECAIPFKILRYKLSESKTNEWNVNFFRNNLSVNERSSWAKMPRSSRGSDLAFSGLLIWDDAPPKPGTNISIIPYVITSSTKDFINNLPAANKSNIGFDAKIALTSSLNLDLTVNPDFSQVEVDRQVTNLSRFELLFPERRQFFIENNDLFGAFGSTLINPFFSRRIGIAKVNRKFKEDTNNDGIIEENAYSKTDGIPILAGARLSGKIDNNWRIGLLSMQTQSKPITLSNKTAINVPESNYSVFALQRKVLSRSNIAFIIANKHNFLKKEVDYIGNDPQANAFHRIIGLDFNHGSKNGYWANKVFIHKALTPINQDGQVAGGISVSHSSPEWDFESNSSLVGKNYTAEIGYVPRNDFIRNATFVFRNFFPKNQKVSKLLNSWGVGVDWDIIKSQSDGIIADWDGTPLILSFRFRNNANIRWSPFRNDFTYLFNDFDPTNTNGKKLEKGTSYNYQSTRLFYQSNTNKRFYFSFQGRIGEYFNGNISAIGGSVNYRTIPYALFSLDYNFNKITLPSGFNSTKLILLSPRAEVTFSKKVFFTTFVQYNNQTNNVNINSRLQWRYKPASDLFIVYTDDYFATDPESVYSLGALGSKNRALVIKLNYWLNI